MIRSRTRVVKRLPERDWLLPDNCPGLGVGVGPRPATIADAEVNFLKRPKSDRGRVRRCKTS
jgi:hypothetical protein